MVFSEKRWMAMRFLSVLANSLVLALSLWTSAFLLAWWVLYKPQHQPHDFFDPGWQRWKSEGNVSTCLFNSAIPQFPNPQSQETNFKVSGFRCQGRKTKKLKPVFFFFVPSWNCCLMWAAICLLSSVPWLLTFDLLSLFSVSPFLRVPASFLF